MPELGCEVWNTDECIKAIQLLYQIYFAFLCKCIGRTSLHTAAYCGSVDVLDILLQLPHCKINSMVMDECTLIFLFRVNNSYKLHEILVRHSCTCIIILTWC